MNYGMRHDERDIEHVLEALVDGDNREVRYLIERHPALVNAPMDDRRWTLLHYASAYGNLNIVDLLLSCGATLDKPSVHGCIPLNMAVIFGHEAVVEKLMQSGSDPNKRGVSGWTPLLDAISRGNHSILQIILNNDGGSSNIRESDQHGDSPLMVACWCGFDVIVEDLLDRGVDINAVHGNGTALMCAVRGSKKDTVKLLLRRGADPTIIDSRGYDALD